MIGGYNQKFICSQDRDLWLRMSSLGLIGCLKEPLVKLRRHEAAISWEKAELQQAMGLCAVLCHLRRQAGMTDPSDANDVQWQSFLAWTEGKIKEKRFEDVFSAREDYERRVNTVTQGAASAWLLLAQPKWLINRIQLILYGSDIPQTLLRESREWRCQISMPPNAACAL
jgi:hypothetical protein